MCVWTVKLHLASYYYAQTRVLKVQLAMVKACKAFTPIKSLRSHYSFAVPCRPADGSPTTTVAQSSENNAWDNKSHKACFTGSTAQTGCFLSSLRGVQGPLIQVYGDMLPPSDFLIIVPRTREVPDMIRAASELIHACHKLWALSVQQQLGQLAVLDTAGILYTMLQCWQCWQTAQNDGFIVHNTTQDNALLQIRSSPCSASNSIAALTLEHGAASTCLIGQSQCSSLLDYLQKTRPCLPL